MAGRQISKILDANVYLNGTNYVGKALEFDPPKVSHHTVDFQTLASIGPVELTDGVEKMECKVKWAAYIKGAFDNIDPFTSVMLTFIVAQQVWQDGSVVGYEQVAYTVRALCKEIAPATTKKGEGMPDMSFAVNYCKCEIDGETVYEIDLLNNIWNTAQGDVYAEVRSILGM
jgi:P2 family phage contractile tail tube protein